MDNISHSAAGLMVGHLADTYLPLQNETDSKLRRNLLLMFSVIANNFPDLDFLYSNVLPPPLGYLLHHRGHTHTLLWAVPQTFLVLLIPFSFSKKIRAFLLRDRISFLGIVLVTLFGFCLHILFDFFNLYGVHPFHPFVSNWFYGDLIFIVEPIFWVTLGFPLLLLIEASKLRNFSIFSLFLVLFCFAHFQLLSKYSFILLVGIGVILSVVHFLCRKPNYSVWTGVLLFTSFIGIQLFFSYQARKIIFDTASNKIPTRVLDIALTPLPSNPFCWNFILLSQGNPAFFQIKSGHLNIFSDDLCQWLDSSQPTSKEGPIEWTGAWEGEVATLRGNKNKNCFFEAWLRFARFPYLTLESATDVRFSKFKRANFSTLKFSQFAQEECPAWVPQWSFPRKDLLND